VLLTIGLQIVEGKEWSRGATLLDVLMLGGGGGVMLAGAVVRLPFGWYAGLVFGGYAFLEPLLTRRSKRRENHPASALRADNIECIVAAVFLVALITVHGRRAFGMEY
jgi:hypothetical protein